MYKNKPTIWWRNLDKLNYILTFDFMHKAIFTIDPPKMLQKWTINNQVFFLLPRYITNVPFNVQCNRKLTQKLSRLFQIWFSLFLPISLEATRCQFHQHFTHGFFVPKFGAKLFCTYILGLNFFRHKNIGANKMLLKLTKGC